MTDLLGWILTVLAFIATAAVIASEFWKAFRAGTVSGTRAGRIAVATGILIIAVSPRVYPGLDESSFAAMSWCGAALIAMGFLLEYLDERKKRSNGNQS